MRAWRVAVPLAGVVAAAALWPATRSLSDLARAGSLGPGFWPRLALLGLALACVAKALGEWRRTDHDGTGEAPAPLSRPKLVIGVVLLVAYAALAPLLGFPLGTFAFVVAFMALAGARSPLGLFVSAATGTIVLVYVFVKVVYLPLPKGEGPLENLTLALYHALGVF